MIDLQIEKRDNEKPSALRAEGKVPAVMYGPKEESAAITLDAAEFTRVWGEAGSSTIVVLKGVGDDKEVLIHDVDVDPVTDRPIHADFYCIERGKKVTVTVPLEFVGEAPAEKLGGIVTKAMHEIEIEVRPSDIPHEIEVDLTKLVNLDSAITIADLGLSADIDVSAELTDTVASIVLPQEEEEDTRDISDVEITTEKPETPEE